MTTSSSQSQHKQPAWWKCPEAIVCIGAFILLAFILLPQRFHGSDMMCWRDWMLQIRFGGLSSAYDGYTDYMPLFQYFLAFYSWCQPDIAALNQHLYLIKIFPLLFDVVGAISLLWLLDNRANRPLLVLMTMFNAAYLYTSLFWGQVDSIYMVLVFLSAAFAYRARIKTSIFLYALAFLFKLQAIIFLPFIGILLLPALVRQFSWLRLVSWLSALLLPFLLILWPFFSDLGKILTTVSTAGERFPIASAHAYNLWYLLLSGDPFTTADSAQLAGFSLKQIGLLLFFTLSVIILWPMFRTMVRLIRNKQSTGFDLESILLTGALLPLCFFLFPTQMHERYGLASFLFLAAWSLLRNRYWMFFFFSVATLLNLEGVLGSFHSLSSQGWLFNPSRIAALFVVIFLVGLAVLYRKKLSGTTESKSDLEGTNAAEL